MGLSADDIENIDFPLARKGYDRAEVERFRAKVAKRVRKLERKLAEAKAAKAEPGESSTELTSHIGEILKLAGEQAERTTNEAEAAAAEIIAAARAEAVVTVSEAAEARTVSLEAIDAVRLRVAEIIEVELGLHDELEAAAAAIRGGHATGEKPAGTGEDPLASVVRDAVDRASSAPR